MMFLQADLHKMVLDRQTSLPDNHCPTVA